MSGNNYQSAPRPVSILDERKLNLTARPLEKGAQPPTLKVGIYRNNPNITVFTNVNNGSGVTSIRAGMDAITFSTIIEIIRYLARDDTPPNQAEIENKKPIPKEQRTDPSVKLSVASKTKIGKDDDGRIWIAILDPNVQNAPRIQFYFEPVYYHSLRFKDESKVDAGARSRFYALGWANLLDNLVTAELGRLASQAASAGGNQGGGYNKGGNGGYGNKGGYGGGNKSGYGNKGYGSNSTSSGNASSGNDSGFSDGDFSLDDDF